MCITRTLNLCCLSYGSQDQRSICIAGWRIRTIQLGFSSGIIEHLPNQYSSYHKAYLLGGHVDNVKAVLAIAKTARIIDNKYL